FEHPLHHRRIHREVPPMVAQRKDLAALPKYHDLASLTLADFATEPVGHEAKKPLGPKRNHASDRQRVPQLAGLFYFRGNLIIRRQRPAGNAYRLLFALSIKGMLASVLAQSAEVNPIVERKQLGV